MPNRLTTAFLILGLLAAGVHAQTDTDVATASTPTETETTDAGVVVSGLFDFYTLYQFQNPPAGTLLPGRLYYDPRHAQPTLALAELNVSKAPAPGGWGFKATLIAGDIADLNHFGGPVSDDEIGGTNTPEGRLKNLQQLYASYQTAGGYTLDVGKFYTPIGFEVTEAPANMNYSHSVPFNILPFYHAGVRVTTPARNGLTFSGYLVNALYNTARAGVNDDNGSKALIGQVLYANGPLTLANNLGWGKERLNGEDDQDSIFYDGWLTYAASPETTLALNIDYRKDDQDGGASGATYTGVAVYAKQVLNERQYAALRYSQLRAQTEPGGESSTSTVTPWEVTATFEHRFTPAFAARVELRHDGASEPLFVNGDGAATRESQDTLLIAGLYSF